jgi:hypothetical protein
MLLIVRLSSRNFVKTSLMLTRSCKLYICSDMDALVFRLSVNRN